MSNTEPSIAQSSIEAALKGAVIALIRRHEAGEGKLQRFDKKEADNTSSNVTKGDWQSEQVIRASVRDATPALLAMLKEKDPKTYDFDTIGTLMEESAAGFAQEKKARDEGLTHTADPIDGTHGYSKNVFDAPFGVLVALEHKGETIAVAVYEADPSEYTSGATPDPRVVGLKGKLFWAEKGRGEAYRIDPSAEGFKVTVEGSLEEQTNVNRIPELKTVPQITVDTSKGNITVLDKSTVVAPGAKLQQGDFMQDRALKAAETGPVITAVKNAAKTHGVEPERCLAAVTGITKAVDGRAAGFAHGAGFPWDHAAKLLATEAGLATIEHAVPGDDAHTALICARDPKLAMAVDHALGGCEVDGKPVIGPAPLLYANTSWMQAVQLFSRQSPTKTPAARV